MKKLLLTGLMSSTVLAGALVAPSVSATVTDNGDGTTTIQGDPTGTIDVVGQIGNFDPEVPVDPTAPAPGDNAWIKVDVPTQMSYYSDPSTQHADIISASNFVVTNRSAYPVAVGYTSFTDQDGTSAPNITSVQSLDLHVTDETDGDKTIPLVTAGALAAPTATPMFKLGGNGALNIDQTGLNTTSAPMTFTGTTVATLNIATQSYTAKNALNITLEALGADGNPV